MYHSKNELKKFASLAYIKIDADNASSLADDVSTIMDFVEQICSVDTNNVKPLQHPLNINQRLRKDKCAEVNQVDELAQIAPSFEADHYLVPKVIETGK